MVAACTRSLASRDGTDYDINQLRTFFFIFSITILHELCHLLQTFLTKGRTGTPKQLRPQLDGYGREGKGEAGRYVETCLFGGTVEYFRDPTREDTQVRSHDDSYRIRAPTQLVVSSVYLIGWHPLHLYPQRCSPNLARNDSYYQGRP